MDCLRHDPCELWLEDEEHSASFAGSITKIRKGSGAYHYLKSNGGRNCDVACLVGRWFFGSHNGDLNELTEDVCTDFVNSTSRLDAIEPALVFCIAEYL